MRMRLRFKFRAMPLTLLMLLFIALPGYAQKSATKHAKETTLKRDLPAPPEKMTDKQWKKVLSAEQYRVLREKGTERAFTGALYDNHEDGSYHCAACGALLFTSDTKYESGSGWPSFYQAANDSAVDTEVDDSLWMKRIEIVCSSCGGHLGHVFDDGPRPTGKRFCVNSASLQFVPEDE